MTDFAFPPRLRTEPAVPPLGERLTPAQAAELIGISEPTLRSWRCQGRGPRYYKLGRVIYWSRDVRAWIASQCVECV